METISEEEYSNSRKLMEQADNCLYVIKERNLDTNGIIFLEYNHSLGQFRELPTGKLYE